MYSSHLFPRPSPTVRHALDDPTAPSESSEPSQHAANEPDVPSAPDASEACAPAPFAMHPVPALANLLAELTSESERYLLAWQASGRADIDAQAASQRMRLARDTVAELALWHSFELELPARLRIVRDALDVRLDAIELHVESVRAFDERLAWFVVGRRVMPGGVRLRALESFRLDAARVWVLHTENGREHARPLRRVASVHVLRMPAERPGAASRLALADAEAAR
jgi:hypothetical protein